MIGIDAWEWTPLMALILLGGFEIAADRHSRGGGGGRRLGACNGSASSSCRCCCRPRSLALILRMMDAFRVFDIIFVTTNGGPGDATDTLMIYGVKQGLEFFNIGAASAVSTVIVVCILAMAGGFIARAATRRDAGMVEPRRLALLLRRVAILGGARRRAGARRLVVLDRLQARERHLRLAAATAVHADARPISPACSAIFDLWSLLKSSLIIALGSTAALAAARRARRLCVGAGEIALAVWLAYFFLIVRTVPPVATLIPFYLLMRDIGLLGTWWAVILINTALNSAFVVWMMFSYFRAMPASIEEAALTDGARDWGAFVARRAADGASRRHRQRDLVHDVFLERLSLRDVSDPLRDQADLGRAAVGLWHLRYFLGHARRARAFLDAAIVLMMIALNRYFVQGLTKGVH